MPDQYENFGYTLTSPAGDCYQVTPNDSADLAENAKGLVVTTAGTLQVTTAKGNTRALPSLPVGFVLACQVSRVWVTNTTATVLALTD